MVIRHLIVGLILGFAAALWSWTEGYSLWAMLGFYVLGGNLGVAGSAGVMLVRALTELAREEENEEPLEA